MSTIISNGDDLHDQRDNNDIELRELVYQTLERDGLISRLKAQLRAAVFKTIEKSSSNPSDISSHPPTYEGKTGQICRGLILDWLEHSNLLYTQDLFKMETSNTISLTYNELLEQLHLDLKQTKSQPILHLLLDQNHNYEKLTKLPDYIKQSIDQKFPTEKINDMNRLREHFRSLFSSAFDGNILDIFINKHLLSTSISKIDYEQICFKFMQSCSKVLLPQSSPIKPTSPNIPITSRIVSNNGQVTTRARRSLSPPSESNSSSSSTTTSQSENPRKNAFDFPLPTTMDIKKTVIKKSTDITPPGLINFNDDDDDDDDNTSSSLFSKRNATSSALNHLKNIEDIINEDSTSHARTIIHEDSTSHARTIIHEDSTSRTRTIIQKNSTNGHKDIPIEYDDDSVSQSVDDITVDKASPSPSANMDFLEDF